MEKICSACGGVAASRAAEGNSVPPFIYCSPDCRGLWEMEEATIAFRAEEARKAAEKVVAAQEAQAWAKEEEKRFWAKVAAGRKLTVSFPEATEASFQEALERVLREQVETGDFVPRGLESQRSLELQFAIFLTPTVGRGITVQYFWGSRRNFEVATRYFEVFPPEEGWDKKNSGTGGKTSTSSNSIWRR